jgi:1-deoxy-D-xylulose-5-phosphate reductoisomerase
MKSISILGSTGSIGTQTLDVIRNNKDKFKVVGLAANNEIEILKQQIKEFNPIKVAVFDEKKAEELRKQIDIEVFSDKEALDKIATLKEADTIVISVVGSIGVVPTLKAIQAKKNIALANKETLVTAGKIIMEEVKKNNVNIMPIDSEHSALFQCLLGGKKENIQRLILTCSGGSFRNKTKDELKEVTIKEALNHPTWEMGEKITIDSATLMNKGFEVIEAHHLYGIPYEKIDVIIHPQSIIHSMVEYIDGSIIAQFAISDMRIPIQYALTYPERLKNKLPKLCFEKYNKLTFDKPNIEKFPCLKYAFDAGKIGGTMPAVLNAANEMAVREFLVGKIKFLQIAETIKKAMENHKIIKNPNINEIIKADEWARKFVEEDLIII